MTARDEAIDAIADWYHQWMYGDNGTNATLSEARRLAEYLVDNIPPTVLARLTIEQGALEQVAWQYTTTTGHPRFLDYFAGEAGHADHERVYRVVEP